MIEKREEAARPMVDCSHISGSVCIAAVNLSQLQILREFNDVDNSAGKNSLRSQKRRISGHDLDKVHWNCVSCDSSESPWLCLACGLIFCGRYVNGHGIKHYQEMNHPRHCLSMQCYTYEVFWWVSYACDDYVGGDTDDGKIYSVRHSLAYFHKARCEDHNYSSQLYISTEDIYDCEDPVDLGTEEEDEVITQAVAERIIQLDEDNGSVPEDEGKPVRTIPDFRPLHAIPDIDTNRSGPLIGGRSLRPRKRKTVSTYLECSLCRVNFYTTEQLVFTHKLEFSSADVFREYLVRLPILEPDDIIDEHQPLASPRYNTRRAASSVCITSTVQPQSSPTLIHNTFSENENLGFHQQDAHEFLRCMMDRLHAELRRCRIPESVDQWLAATCGGGNIPNGSAVTTMFEGSLQSQVVCLTCHTASNKHDPFMGECLPSIL
uniref:ubiquitinyl hydrolase 1 n=1 Tax=Heterorhabditis bacteriophora TaxID=37862 RepID=A0A1I7WIR9_HETBA